MLKRFGFVFALVDGVIITLFALFYVRPFMPQVALVLVAAFYVVLTAVLVTGCIWVILWLRKTHLQAQVVYPSQHGAWIKHGTQMVPLPAITQSLNVQEIRKFTNTVTPAAAVNLLPELSQSLDVPVAPIFKDIEAEITKDSMILGYDGYGEPVLGTILDLLSTNVVGKPGRGKSTALYFFTAQLMRIGAIVQIFDPHGALASLAKATIYEHDYDRMSACVNYIRKEMTLRKRRYVDNGSKCFDRHYLLIVDEMPAIASWERNQNKLGNKSINSILALIEDIVLQGRKFNMYVMVSGQGMPATVLPTLTRDSLSSHFVFYTTDRHAQLAGLDKDVAKALLPRIRHAGPGVCVLDAVTREPELVAIPYTTVEDVYECAAVAANEPTTDGVLAFPFPTSTAKQVVSDEEYAFLEEDKSGEKEPVEHFPGVGNVPVKVVEAIVTLAQSGKVKRGDMCAALGWGMRKYTIVKAVLDSRGLLIDSPANRLPQFRNTPALEPLQNNTTAVPTT